MPELLLEPEQATPPSPEEMQAGIAEAGRYLTDVAPHLGRLFGMDLSISLGEKWATDMQTGNVTADPRFFIEKGYTPDMTAYATLHEVAAHLREVVNEPHMTDRVVDFIKQGEPQSLFNNILADVAGNNLIHAVLPRMKHTAHDLYREKLFAETDYTGDPRHGQFLYKIIREAMVPDEPVKVLPEVDEALARLRDFQGQGDVIAYSTAYAKSANETLGLEERFSIWMSIIYPEFEALLEQDRQDPNMQDNGDAQPGESGEGQPGESKPGGSPDQEGQPSPPSEGQSADGKRFKAFYDDYKQNRHPDPLSQEDEDKLHEYAKARAKEAQKRPEGHDSMLDRKLRAETGHSLNEQRHYNAEVLKWQAAIDEMREVFQTIIQERVGTKRGLSRRTFAEGAILDPNRLAQTVIDMNTGTQQPEAFLDYTAIRGKTESVGKTDYAFLFDVSKSMKGEKAAAAASSAVIGLEGLAALQRDVEEAEAAHHVELDLDIRTAMYTFGEGVTCLKPLSTKVSPKERLDAHAALRNPKDGATRDFLAVEALEGLAEETDRRRIAIVVSDGGTYDPTGGNTSARTRRAVDRLRGNGWLVYGISIGSDEAEQLYSPTAKRVDDPARLPDTIRGFIEATIS